MSKTLRWSASNEVEALDLNDWAQQKFPLIQTFQKSRSDVILELGLMVKEANGGKDMDPPAAIQVHYKE